MDVCKNVREAGREARPTKDWIAALIPPHGMGLAMTRKTFGNRSNRPILPKKTFQLRCNTELAGTNR